MIKGAQNYVGAVYKLAWCTSWQGTQIGVENKPVPHKIGHPELILEVFSSNIGECFVSNLLLSLISSVFEPFGAFCC